LIEQGENIKYIQNQLGHSSSTVTWNVYAHLMKPVNQEAACKLEKTVFETNGSRQIAFKLPGMSIYPRKAIFLDRFPSDMPF